MTRENWGRGTLLNVRSLAAEVRSSPIQGLGVFATTDLPAGEHLWSFDDSRVVDAEHPLRTGEEERHCDYLADGLVVHMQVPERHINHSCDPNCYVITHAGDRVIVARRDILRGEEITNDYAINGEGGVPWACRCGAERCRGSETWADYFKLPRSLQEEYRPFLEAWFAAEYSDRLRELGL